MRNTDYFKGKKVTVIGLARSGLAAAQLLHSLGAKVSISDNQDNPALRRAAAGLISQGIEAELGRHSRGFVSGRDYLVVSPGVRDTAAPVAWAGEDDIPVISEVELGWLLCPATVIAVTGSGGKTTVTTLIAKVIEAAGKKAYPCGNIGNPFCGEVEKLSPEDFVSLEVSSFQLEKIRSFKPKIAVILNFNRNHLDRHRDMEEYLAAKKRIFMNQGESDFLLLNSADPVLKGLAAPASPRVVYFQGSAEYNPNQAAVLAVAGILGIGADACRRVFQEFKGLPHRLEYVAEAGGVKFINDSKATLAESTVWALKNISSPVVLIAGGKDKGIDYASILEAARGKVKQVVLIGEAKEKIAQALAGALPVQGAPTLEEAVSRAYSLADPGDCVLLSPMCSSFDMFSGYEERGEVFKQVVFNLINRRITNHESQSTIRK